MEHKLSERETQLIARACDRAPAWAPHESQPLRLSGVLTEGLSNRSYLLAGERRYVLRITEASTPPGVDRERELRMHALAAAARLAPAILFADVREGILITEFIGSAETTANPESLADFLRELHRLPVTEPPLSLTARLRAWETRRPDDSPVTQLLAGSDGCEAAIYEAAAALDQQTAVLCHNDLLAANRRWTEHGLRAIDWEYAAPGAAAFDLAVCASELNEAQRGSLLTDYLERTPAAEDWHNIERAERVYAVLAAHWYTTEMPDSPEARQSLARLEQHLSGQ